MERAIITKSEYLAAYLMKPALLAQTITTPNDIHNAADQLLMLAEKVKAERAVAAMELER